MKRVAGVLVGLLIGVLLSGCSDFSAESFMVGSDGDAAPVEVSSAAAWESEPYTYVFDEPVKVSSRTIDELEGFRSGAIWKVHYVGTNNSKSPQTVRDIQDISLVKEDVSYASYRTERDNKIRDSFEVNPGISYAGDIYFNVPDKLISADGYSFLCSVYVRSGSRWSLQPVRVNFHSKTIKDETQKD